MYEWPWQKLELEFWTVREFKYPEMMARTQLLFLEELRRRCGSPLHNNGDGRLRHDMRRIYPELEEPAWPDSAHYVIGDTISDRERDCQANDLEPEGRGTLPDAEFNRRMGVLAEKALALKNEGTFPAVGVEIATRHIHVDTFEIRRWARRPRFWVGKSR